MKRSGFLQRSKPLKQKSSSETTDIKQQIQAVARECVIIRDGGCILRNMLYRDFPQCGGPLQADHLITRANSATFADLRLIVCVCRNHHAWKSLGSNARKAEYDVIVKRFLPRDRVELWERAEQDSWRPHRNYLYDWKLELAALQQTLKQELAPHMNRLYIPDELRLKVYSPHPREIICVDARNFIQVVDTLNSLIDDYNKRHSEVPHETLMAVLNGD